MDLFEAIRKVEACREFKAFKKANPGSYLCAAFFILDYELKEEKKSAKK